MTDTVLNEPKVLEALRQVIDPELGCNLVDLGLIYDVKIESGKVQVTMTVTTPGCPMHDSLCAGVRNALLNLEGVTDAEVELVFEPPWQPSMMTDAGRAMTGANRF
ncbi:MIP18 family protein YitW [Verrucomicrobia bacterium]|nr:MIP18 family protein YitW [Verrucomicrobiota bacterium]